jgi:hypothetical protein
VDVDTNERSLCCRFNPCRPSTTHANSKTTQNDNIRRVRRRMVRMVQPLGSSLPIFGRSDRPMRGRAFTPLPKSLDEKTRTNARVKGYRRPATEDTRQEARAHGRKNKAHRRVAAPKRRAYAHCCRGLPKQEGPRERLPPPAFVPKGHVHACPLQRTARPDKAPLHILLQRLTEPATAAWHSSRKGAPMTLFQRLVQAATASECLPKRRACAHCRRGRSKRLLVSDARSENARVSCTQCCTDRPRRLPLPGSRPKRRACTHCRKYQTDRCRSGLPE